MLFCSETENLFCNVESLPDVHCPVLYPSCAVDWEILSSLSLVSTVPSTVRFRMAEWAHFSPLFYYPVLFYKSPALGSGKKEGRRQQRKEKGMGALDFGYQNAIDPRGKKEKLL